MDAQNFTLQTPETEDVTPTWIQPFQPTNGVLRRHPPIHINHFHHPGVVTYKECLKNFAASIGGHVIDGCGEFLPAPTSNLSDPQSLLCDVCSCHRNFHRRDEEYFFAQPIVLCNSHVHMAPNHEPGATAVPANPNVNGVGVSRKRFRTKFTKDQKGMMLELGEKIGWKMQKRNEIVINESCKEIGVERRVFTVWMHNNKSIVGKKETSDNSVAEMVTPPIIVTNNVGNGVGLSESNLENCVGSSEGNFEKGVTLSEGDLGNEDHIDEKGEEEIVVVGTDGGSSPSATV